MVLLYGAAWIWEFDAPGIAKGWHTAEQCAQHLTKMHHGGGL
jgi:hypothetical protein